MYILLFDKLGRQILLMSKVNDGQWVTTSSAPVLRLSGKKVNATNERPIRHSSRRWMMCIDGSRKTKAKTKQTSSMQVCLRTIARQSWPRTRNSDDTSAAFEANGRGSRRMSSAKDQRWPMTSWATDRLARSTLLDPLTRRANGEARRYFRLRLQRSTACRRVASQWSTIGQRRVCCPPFPRLVFRRRV